MLRRNFFVTRTQYRLVVVVPSQLSTTFRSCSSANTNNSTNYNSWFEWVQKEAIPVYQQQQQNSNQTATSLPITTELKPPAWFQTLCEDLYFRKDSEMYDEMARDSAESMKLENNNNSNDDKPNLAVDPFLWLEFQIFPEEQYRFEKFEFPYNIENHFSPECKKVLLGGEGDQSSNKTMCCFASAYKFPDRRQLPITVGTESSHLWIDPSNPNSQVVYIQLNPIFPPSMWLPVKATAKAIRRVFAEFATTAAIHRDRHELFWTRRWNGAQIAVNKSGNSQFRSDPGAVLRLLSHAASRDGYYDAEVVKEYHNSQEFFLGEFSDPETQIQKFIDLCPTVFSTPIFRTNVNLHEDHVPMINGPGVATSLYRCVYSKALLLVQVHLATEVKLPPLDHDAFKMLWTDSGTPPPSKVPVFVRIVWPASDGDSQESSNSSSTTTMMKSARMAGGGHINRYLNSKLGTEFAHDVPVDVVFSLLYISQWINRPHDFLGVHGMRQRLLEIEEKMLNGEAEQQRQQLPDDKSTKTSLLLLAERQNEKEQNGGHILGGLSGNSYPGTAEIPSPHYTPEEELAMHIQYAAHLQDPLAKDTIVHYMNHQSGAIRMGCAKAALEVGDRGLFKKIAEHEPDGRFKHFMSELVRLRKKRDLFDPEMRVDDGQFELPAPIWARSVRIDPATKDGQRYFGRAKIRGAIGTHKAVRNVFMESKAD